MGVPTFFLQIIKNKFYKNVHNGIENGKVNCDYFFMDFNGTVYNAYEIVKKRLEGQNISNNKLEELLIEEVISLTQNLICNVIKPKKMTYIALDGPAPRAKMVQQRSRRFKAPMEKEFMKNLRKKYNINDDTIDWDRSANISPGTKFMEKLSNGILNAMKNKTFQKHNENMSIIFNNGNVPGEGEHKFLDIIRKMRTIEISQNDSIYLYGRDADLIVLAVTTHKNNIHIVREIKAETDKELKKTYEDYEYLQINIDQLADGFYKELIRKNQSGKKFQKVNVLNDYIFLTFLVGNDFVPSLPFLKIKKGGLNKIIDIYHKISNTTHEYLVLYDIDKKKEPIINYTFLLKIFLYTSENEDSWMKNDLQREIDRSLTGSIDQRTQEAEENMSTYEKMKTRYTHMHIANPNHPLFSIYQEEIRSLDFKKDYDIWSQDYYNFYLGITKNNIIEYTEMKDKLVLNYLESLAFTLKYYFTGCPSWQWHYQFRVAPLLNDISNYMSENANCIENIHFKLGKPYTPYQQLMLILPPQVDYIIPEQLRPIMHDDKIGCTQFYPLEARLDVTVGGKTMYSEPILPEIDESLLLNIIKKEEENLTKEEKIRNEIRTKSFRI